MKDGKVMGSMTAKRGPGDRAVDGLLRGMAAGLVMALVMAGGGILWGETVADLFGRFAPVAATPASASPISAPVGFLAHIAVSAIYGLLFALLWHVIGLPWRRGATGLGVGAVYGLTLWVLAHFVLLRGSESGLLALPGTLLAMGHLAYGLALGWLMGRNES